MVDRNLVREGGRIIAADPRTPIGIHTDAKIPHTCLQFCSANNVTDGGVDIVIDLCGVRHCCVLLIIEGQEEDVRDER